MVDGFIEEACSPQVQKANPGRSIFPRSPTSGMRIAHSALRWFALTGSFKA